MYPHSVPFRQPVDPVLEQIPVTVLFVVHAVAVWMIVVAVVVVEEETAAVLTVELLVVKTAR